MKKIISMILIIAMLFSISACKRSDTDDEVAVAVGENDKAESKTEEQKNTEDDVPASPQNQDDTQAEENKTESEKPVQQENKTETQKSSQEEDKTETQQPVQEENKTETQEPSQEENEFAIEGKVYPDDVYLSEYMPLKKGFVTKQSRSDGPFYRANSDFVIKELITEQMIDAAKKYPYDENETFNPDKRVLSNIIPNDAAGGFYLFSRDDYDSLLAYVEEFIKNDYVIKGHFEQGYGIAYTYNEVKNLPKGSRCNYMTTGYTLFNFVIEQVYSENCIYKAGDVIEVALPGTIYQAVDGFYRGDFEYDHFKNATLEERSYILSVMPKNEQSRYRDIVRVSNIRQNVFEQVPDLNDDYYNLSREILEKYK